MKRLNFLLVLLCAGTMAAQDIKLSGLVRDKYSGDPVSDVNIYIDNAPLGTISDADGFFTLTVPEENMDSFIVFNHVAYDSLKLNIKKAMTIKDFILVPSLSQTSEISVKASRPESEFEKDIPLSIKIIKSEDFENRGYSDVADLLRNEQSITVNETESGRKTISMRGGNSDDVVVFYNGVKMINNYNNTFDISLINLEDIEQIELIKGSNTVLFGSEAFSGVINIVPKKQSDHTGRFVQKFGSYDMGEWNLQFSRNISDRFFANYTATKAGSKRDYEEVDSYLQNESESHSANMIFSFGDSTNSSPGDLSLLYLNSSMDYTNFFLDETINDFNQLASIRYDGFIGPWDGFGLSASYQELDNEQGLRVDRGSLARNYFNKNAYFNFEKRTEGKNWAFILLYQFEQGELDFKENRAGLDTLNIGTESAFLSRKKHGFASIVKFQTPTGAKFLETANADFSYRYDQVNTSVEDILERGNGQSTVAGLDKDNLWKANLLKFSTELKGSIPDLSYSIFLNNGTNIKFPTMFQQLSLPAETDPDLPQFASALKPEENKSFEAGIELIKETPLTFYLDGWDFRAAYFQNLYTNKFRTYYLPGIPVAFYDNVRDASLSGFDVAFNSYFMRNMLSFNLGGSWYDISDRAAFPFKSETKYTAGLLYYYRDFSAAVNWFKESRQVGWIRERNGEWDRRVLDGFNNFNINLAQRFSFLGFEGKLTGAVHNVLTDDTVLQGLTIRDRRFYIGIEITGLEKIICPCPK